MNELSDRVSNSAGWRTFRRAATTTGSDRAGLLTVALLLAAGLGCWLVGLRLIDPDRMGSIGLVAILPLPVFAAYVLIIAGFVLSLRRSLVATPLPFAFLVGLVLLLHATPAISYETLRYSWAWKHIGVIDFIMRTGHLDQSARFLSAYHNWPGFFVFFAAIGGTFRLDPLAIANLARFYPTVMNLAYLAILPALFRNLTSDPRVTWAAVGIFLVGNWVGQDYFSPQATTFLFYLALLALLTGPLARRSALGTPGGAKDATGRLRFWQGLPVRTHPEYLPSALLLIVMITVTHQLTPIFVLSALFVLFVIGRVSFGYFLVALVAELLWLFYFADPFVAPLLGELLAEIGSLGAGTVERLVDLDVVSDGQKIVSVASRAITLVVVAAGLLGGILRWRRGYRDVTAIALTIAPLPLLIATPYGGEIAFRLYFFALPFLGFFAATLFFSGPTSPGRSYSPVLLAGLMFLLVPGFLLANNGKDQQYWFSRDEVKAADWLYSNSRPGQLLIEGSRNYPSQFRNYENFIYVPLADELPDIEQELLAAPQDLLAQWLADSERGGYIIITTSQKALFNGLGLLPKDGLQRIEDALTRSPRLKIVFSNADATIFTLS